MLDNLHIRPADSADLDRAVDLFNRESTALNGTRDFNADDVRVEWSTPGFDPTHDTRIAVDDDGVARGYVEVWNTSRPFVRPTAWFAMDPRVTDDGLALQLLSWARSRAETDLPKAPPDAMVTFATYAYEHDPAGRRRCESFGLYEARRYYRMEISLDDPIEEPRVPATYVVRAMSPGEERATYRAVFDAFADHFGVPRDRDFDEGFARWKHDFLDDPKLDPELFLIAVTDAGGVAGVSMSVPWDGDDRDTGWVEQLAVTREHRGRGVGRALLTATFRAMRAKRKRRAGLGVDATSLTGATRLYESCGMRPSRTTILYSLVLREGEDYRRTSA
ncbi:MAG: GNAT family N-acetyltransferase [Spirochaetota bacterium]